MKKVAKKVTMQTLDKKIDGVANAVGTLSDTVGTLSDTVDSLARSTKEGFDRMDTFHDEMNDFVKKTGVTLFSLDSHARTANERLDAIEKVLGPLIQTSSFYQSTLREHERRLSLIEREVGLAKQT